MGDRPDSALNPEPEEKVTWFAHPDSGYGTGPAVTAVNSTAGYYPDEYEYDYAASIQMMPLDELVPVGLVYGLTFLLGITGNSLVIFTICRHWRLRSPTNIFLVSLATADLLLVLVCIPIKVSKNGFSINQDVCHEGGGLLHLMFRLYIINHVVFLSLIAT